MSDFQQSNELGEAATVDIIAAVMVERFGTLAAAVATDQLAAVHETGGNIADRWLSIVMSIEYRLSLDQTAVVPAIPPSTAGGG